MKFSMYLYGQLKRIQKLFPQIFALSVLFAIVIGICGMLYANNNNYTKKTTKYDVGLLCDEDDKLVSLGMYLVQTIDDSKYIINLRRFTSEQDGFDALHANRISAFLEVPSGMVEALKALDEPPKVKLYTASQKGITTVIMEEVASLVSDDLIYTEAGLLAYADELSQSNLSESKQNLKLDALLVRYLSTLLVRGQAAKITALGLGNGLSMLGFFLCGLVLFYTVMLSFCNISFFLGKRIEFSMITAGRGMKARAQIVAEYLCFFLSNLLCAVFTMFCLYVVLRTDMFEIPEFVKRLGSGFVWFAFGYLWVLLGLTAFEYLLFESISGIVNKFLMTFIILVGCSFLSGYFYPASFLPPIATKIGQWLPTGVAYQVLAAHLKGGVDPIAFAVLAAYMIAALALSAVIRRYKIEKGTD